MSRRKQKRLLIGAIAAAAVLLLAFAAWLAIPGLRTRGPVFLHAWPGRAGTGYTASRLTVTNLASGADALLGSDGVWRSWQRLAGRSGTPPAVSSDTVGTDDQVLLMRRSVESGNRTAFQEIFRYLRDKRTGTDGRLLGADGAPADNRVALDALRAMAEAYSAWGGKDVEKAIRSASGALLGSGGNQGLPADAALNLPGPSPTPGTLISPTPAAAASPTPAVTGIPVQTRPFVLLAGLDLYTMKLLSSIDARWEQAATSSLAVIKSAFLDEILPLYRAGTDPATGTVIPYTGDKPVVDTLSSLIVILHLCETGAQRAESVAWIRQCLYNDGAIYASYAIVSGDPFDRTENPACYAVAARIARILEDKDLYGLATARLTWQIADLRSSPAYGTVFRTTADGLVEVRAADNAWALLGLD